MSHDKFFNPCQAQDGSSEDKIQAVLAALHERQRIKKDALSDFEKRKQRMRVSFRSIRLFLISFVALRI